MAERTDNRSVECEETLHISETARVRSKTEQYLLEAAKTAVAHARKHRQDNNSMEELKAALSAVILAQAAIEGCFHDLLDTSLLARCRKRDYDAVMRRPSREERIEEGLKLLTGEAVDKGRQPWQDFHLLRMIRNALVHYQPTWETSDDEPVKLLQSIRAANRFPLREGRSRWEEKVLTADCAEWAVRTAEAMIQLFAEAKRRFSALQ